MSDERLDFLNGETAVQAVAGISEQDGCTSYMLLTLAEELARHIDALRKEVALLQDASRYIPPAEEDEHPVPSAKVVYTTGGIPFEPVQGVHDVHVPISKGGDHETT